MVRAVPPARKSAERAGLDKWLNAVKGVICCWSGVGAGNRWVEKGLNRLASSIGTKGLRATAGGAELSAFGEQETIGFMSMPQSEARVSKRMELVKLL